MSVRTIVVGADGSKGSRRAVAWACALAADLGARVVLVHTFEPLAHLGDAPPPYDFAALEERARALLEGEWSRPAVEAGVDHVGMVRHGSPAQVILDTAESVDADLIVLGTRGLGTFAGIALGSTSTKVVHLSRRPVAVVPPSPREA